nr:hypothetical protein [Tanacetum cinerariifolium]
NFKGFDLALVVNSVSGLVDKLIDLDDKGKESDGAYTPYNNFDECINDEMANLGLETKENPVVNDVEYKSNIYATCEANTSPTKVQSISDEENNLEESHSNKDQAYSLKMQVEEEMNCNAVDYFRCS